MKELIWVLIAVAVFAGWKIFQTNRLNGDEKQSHLCAVIREFDQTQNLQLFLVAYHNIMFIEEGRERKTRFAHALSMAKPHISRATYDIVRSIFRRDGL